MTADPSMPGFARSNVSLANWRITPFSKWSFQNVQEIVPSAVIRAARRGEDGARADLGALRNLPVALPGGAETGLADFLEKTETDSFVVMKGGRIVGEWQAAHCDPGKPHIIYSVSKSLTGLLAGIMADRGMLDPGDPVTRHVPEAEGSAYGDARLRDLLDMQVSLEFTEDYLDKTGDYDRYRRATAWNPQSPDDPSTDLKSFLCALRKGSHEHGTVHAYRSPNTDMMGIVLERAAGRRLHQLLGEMLWQPMDARTDGFVTVDRTGTARAAGGISVTARDLARLGEIVRKGGAGIVPSWWIEDIAKAGNSAIWKQGDQVHHFPEGRYRSYWYQSGHGEIAAIGIHGQWVWIDPEREVTIVKQSSQALPGDEALDDAITAMLMAVAKAA